MQKSWRVGKYEMIEKIGHGGMAEVWRARFLGDNGFVKDVAVKRILPELSKSSEIVSMFLDEAIALVKLRHQNIVQVYELFEAAQSHFIAMELVDGVDLRRLIRSFHSSNELMPAGVACFIVAQVLKGLDHAHQNGVVHRDISPQNILISFNGEVKVADFGIAKGEHRSTETIVGNVRGKFAYMSPEQSAQRPVDQRCDLYSLGMVFYELLCGAEPKNETLQNAPREVRPILRRALKSSPCDRYQSAGDFLSDLFAAQKIYGLISHENDLASIVRTHFQEEFKTAVARNMASGTCFTVKPVNACLFWQRIAQYAAIVALFFVSFAVVGADSPSPKKLQDVATAVLAAQNYEEAKMDKAAASIAGDQHQPEQMSRPTKLPEEKKPVLKPKDEKKNAYAYLSVGAKPWGYVILDGDVLNRSETPLVDKKIAAGRHKIELVFEASGGVFSRYFTVSPSEKISCFANSEKSDGLSCKSIK